MSVYRYVLEAFPRLGRAPTLTEMLEELDLSEASVRQALRSLETDDAVRLDRTTS